MKTKLSLFLTMLKIGAFTFGGGYAMIALLQSEFVEKKGWVTSEEFTDLVGIAESTPGPIAVNSATYIGYKVGKFWGALFATVAVCLPSFVIIYLVSLFFDAFLSLTVVANAFKGVRVCVVFLIASAGLKMIKSLEKSVFNIILCFAVFVATALCTFFAVNFSTVFYVLICGAIGIITMGVKSLTDKQNKQNQRDKPDGEEDK